MHLPPSWTPLVRPRAHLPALPRRLLQRHHSSSSSSSFSFSAGWCAGVPQAQGLLRPRVACRRRRAPGPGPFPDHGPLWRQAMSLRVWPAGRSGCAAPGGALLAGEFAPAALQSASRLLLLRHRHRLQEQQAPTFPPPVLPVVLSARMGFHVQLPGSYERMRKSKRQQRDRHAWPVVLVARDRHGAYEGT